MSEDKNEQKSIIGTVSSVSIKNSGICLILPAENGVTEKWFNADKDNEQAKGMLNLELKGKEVELMMTKENPEKSFYSITELGAGTLSPVQTRQTTQKVPQAKAAIAGKGKAPTKLMAGDIEIPSQFVTDLMGKQYINHHGLLHIAHKMGLVGIETEHISLDPTCIIFKATVTMKVGKVTKIFTGYGDADKGNVNDRIAQHYIRMAETRAINRALRLATNIGMTSEEELGKQDENNKQA